MKIACFLFATTWFAVALPSLCVSTRWKPGRRQSLLQILQCESNHTSALRRVEKLHQGVRRHSITHPKVIAWLQQKHARKWFLTTKYNKVVSYHSLVVGCANHEGVQVWEKFVQTFSTMLQKVSMPIQLFPRQKRGLTTCLHVQV